MRFFVGFEGHISKVDSKAYTVNSCLLTLVRFRNWYPQILDELYLDNKYGGLYFFFDDCLRESKK